MSFLIIHDHSHGIYHILPSILGIFHQDFLGVGCPEPPWLRADLAICAAAGRISAGHLQKKPTDGFDGIRDPILGYHRATVSQVCQEKYGTYGKYVCNDCVMLCTRTPQKVHQVWPCR